MTIPPDAVSRVDARIRALRPGEGARIELVLDAARSKDGTLRVTADVDLGERYAIIVQESLDVEGPEA